MIIAWVLLVVYLLACIWWYFRDYEEDPWLSSDELDEINSIMMHFHERPDIDDFNEIFNHRAGLSKEGMDYTIKFWLWGVKSKHGGSLTDTQKRVIEEYDPMISRIMRRVAYAPIPLYVDCIWALYFATGDQKYSDLVKALAAHDDDKVADAASWSYRKIMGVTAIEDEEDA